VTSAAASGVPSGSHTGLSAPASTTPTTPEVSVQIRTLLDPATLSEIQRLERSGQPLTDPDALEKMAAALRQRAHALEQQARAVRARAHP
jgi:hypothetical protein